MPRVNNHSFYKKSIRKYGATAEGVHWNSEHTQQIRFEIIASLLSDVNDLVIADAGCGFGHFYDYLEENNRVPMRYIGLELHEKMVAHSNQRGLEVYKCDVLRDGLPEADYYVASGSLNLLHPFETLLFIRRIRQHARKGIIFNMLKGKSSRKSTYNKYEPLELLKHLGVDAQDAVIVEDYLEDDDFTIMLRA